MFDLLRAQPAKRAAYSALVSFFDNEAAGASSLQPGIWLEPHIIGFLAAFVTLVAERTAGQLRAHAMASIQSSVVGRLTGLAPELIGERIALLSSLREPAFEAGCAGAVAFLAVIDGQNATVVDWREPESRTPLEDLWNEHVQQFLRPELQR